MSYSKINFENKPSKKSPINAENLNHMEQGIFEAHVSIAELEIYKANSILSKISGEVITTTDSAKAKPKNIKLFGKGKQRQYEGNQLLNLPNVEEVVFNGVKLRCKDGAISINGTTTDTIHTGMVGIKQDKIQLSEGSYYISGSVENVVVIAHVVLSDGSMNFYNDRTFELDGTEQEVNIYVSVSKGVTLNTTIYPMFNSGTEKKSFEPYVGNQPSPNMNYPQKVECHGESGSVGGRVLNKNFLNITMTSQTISGVEFTVNDDKSISVNGIANGDIFCNVGTVNLCNNDEYIISGCPRGGYTNSVNYALFYNADVTSGNGWDTSYTSVFKPALNGVKNCSIYIKNGVELSNVIFYPMVRRKEFENSTYEPSKGEQPFTFQTPNGLRGIPLGQTIPDAIKNSPIHMSGVYWDGEQYHIADTKNENGKDVQRVFKTTIDGNSNIFDYGNPKTSSNIFGYGISGIVKNSLVLCNNMTCHEVWGGDFEGIWVGADDSISIRLTNDLTGITTEDSSEQKVAKVKELLTNNPIEIYYWKKDEPIITDTTEEEKTQLDALVMNYPNTTIVNDEGAYMEVEHVADTKKHIEQNYVSKAMHEEHENRIAELEKAIVNS